MSEKVIVIVEMKGGCVTNVTAGDFVDVHIRDWDNHDELVCPKCGGFDLDVAYPRVEDPDALWCNDCEEAFVYEPEPEE